MSRISVTPFILSSLLGISAIAQGGTEKGTRPSALSVRASLAGSTGQHRAQQDSIYTKTGTEHAQYGPHILSSERFFEKQTREAYSAAAKHPELLKMLFPWIGCDVVEGHNSLFDCFCCDSAAGDPTTLTEAIEACKLYDEHVPIWKIQKLMDEKYSSERDPSFESSAAFEHYKKHRLYKP